MIRLHPPGPRMSRLRRIGKWCWAPVEAPRILVIWVVAAAIFRTIDNIHDWIRWLT